MLSLRVPSTQRLGATELMINFWAGGEFKEQKNQWFSKLGGRGGGREAASFLKKLKYNFKKREREQGKSQKSPYTSRCIGDGLTPDVPLQIWAEMSCHSCTTNVCEPCTPSTWGPLSIALEEPSFTPSVHQHSWAPCVCQAEWWAPRREWCASQQGSSDKGTVVSRWNRQP